MNPRIPTKQTEINPEEVDDSIIQKKTLIANKEKEKPLFVSLSEEGKSFSHNDISLIGGKASQLAFLTTSFGKDLVPQGFILTTEAQIIQEKSLNGLASTIQELQHNLIHNIHDTKEIEKQVIFF